MDDNNPAPRLLSRPGEGIYNDAAGNIQGNSPFQAVWISDEERDGWLDKIRAKADASEKNYSAPIVFEGDAPADVRENTRLQKLLGEKPTASPVSARIWLGAPNSIKGPTEAAFQRQSGNNLLIVGQRDEATLAILAVAVVSLAAQFPADRARIILLDGNPPGSTSRNLFEKIAQAHPQFVSLAKANEVSEIMNRLMAELKSRAESDTASTAPATFVIIHDLQKIARLRYEDDFSFSSSEETAANPAAQLNRLITEGPALGIHVIATCDSYNNVNRFLSKKAFSEFEMRVLFQMSANDSASLIDNPKAGTLGMHRAIFYNEQEGYLELFRPYAMPEKEWIMSFKNNS
ncbi:MAG: ATP-binding protein, partial [Verrucomicrobiota bacterium]